MYGGRISYLCWFVMLASLLFVITGRSLADGGMSLEAALVLAYETNPKLEAGRANLRSTDEGVAKAISAWRPTVSGVGSYGLQKSSRTGLENELVRTNPMSQQLTVSETLLDGRMRPNIHQAKEMVEAGRAELASTEQSVLLAAVTAYCDVVRDTMIVTLYRENVSQLRGFLANTKQRLKLGELTKTDTSQAEARLAGAEINLVAGEQQLATSRAAFVHVIGRTPEALQPVTMPTLPESEEALLEIALQDNPSIFQSRARLRAADHGVAAASGALLPTLSVQGQYGRTADEVAPGVKENGFSVIGRLTIPLYQGGAEQADIRAAKEQRNQATFEMMDAERQVREDTHNAWHALIANRSSLQLATMQMHSNEVAFEGSKLEARVGSRTTIDILNANLELVQSRVTEVSAEAATTVAGYQVLSAMGHLTAEHLNLPVTRYDPQKHYDHDATRWFGVGE